MQESLDYDIFNLPECESHPISIRLEYDQEGGYEGVKASPVTLTMIQNTIKKFNVTITPQQLMELGTLFIALAGTVNIDFNMAENILSLYDLKGKEAFQKLSQVIKE